MKPLNRRAFAGFAQLLAFLGLAIFVPAGSLRYWQGWTFLGVFFFCTLAITLFLMRHDPALLERRIEAGPRAEERRTQRVLQALAAVLFLSLFIVSSLDHRFSWSPVSGSLSVLGDILVALGLGFVFWVFRTNSFAAATIQVTPEQRVVSTGPYALVRHPMYSGALIMLAGVPLALGSWFGSLPLPLMIAALVVRLQDEERLLVESLDGYQAYRQKVRFRLVPGVW